MNPALGPAGWAKYWLPEDFSSHGPSIDLLMAVVHWFMLALFVGWGIFFVYCLVRFRAKAQPAAVYEHPKAKLSKGAELAVIIFEIVLLVGFSMPVWAAGRHKDEFPKEDESLVVRVVAQQFQWNVHYPGPDRKFGRTASKLVHPVDNPIGLDRKDPAAKDDIVNLGWLRVPVNKPVIVRLTSLDVIHSFAIPVMRVKQDTVPGMETPVWFKATRTTDESKTYNIACAQLCGLNHYSMRGFFQILPQDKWDQWQAKAVQDAQEESEDEWGDEDEE
jgi:cytochrome c oxidase subunit 2